MVTPDEDNMRVDRFLEARFPGLSFSHIQRIVRKGELRVNGKRADSKDRLKAGQSVRIPPLRLDGPKAATALSEAETRTLQQLKEMTLFEDEDVLVAQLFHHRNLRVERPIRQSSMVMIQKRTTTCVSFQPVFSKWWCSGAISRMRCPVP